MAKIFLAGHRGMVGGAILRQLLARDEDTVLIRSRAELDLTNQEAVRDFMHSERPDVVILAAARVGGIMANNRFPADFIYDNIMIEANVIHQAFLAGVERLLCLGSPCIYPRAVPQSMREEALLTGWVLVTSASHMPRAMRSFEAAGWTGLVAHPVDYRTGSFRDGLGWDLLGHLEILNAAIRAQVGQVAYRLTGR